MKLKHLVRSLFGTEMRGSERSFGEQLSDRRYAEHLIVRGQQQRSEQERLTAEQAELARQRELIAQEQRRIEAEKARLAHEQHLAEVREQERRAAAAQLQPAPPAITPELVAQVMHALSARGVQAPQMPENAPATPHSAHNPTPARAGSPAASSEASSTWHEPERIPDEALDDAMLFGADDLYLWEGELAPEALPVPATPDAPQQAQVSAEVPSATFDARIEETQRKMSAIAAIDATVLPDFENTELPSATDVMLAQLRASGHATIREGCARGRRAGQYLN